MTRTVGILTAGGDSPGLNAAIRAVGKAAQRAYGMDVIGFHDGFRGLAENRFVKLESEDLSGILARGGTVLGTGRLVGTVSSIDDVHNILVAGRADLCVLARSHLVDPYWTMNAAIDLGYIEHGFPDQHLSGLTARGREQDPITPNAFRR